MLRLSGKATSPPYQDPTGLGRRRQLQQQLMLRLSGKATSPESLSISCCCSCLLLSNPVGSWYGGEVAFPESLSISCCCSCLLLTSKDHLCKSGIVEGQVPWNMLLVEPFLNSRRVAEGLVRRVVGVIDHVLREELRHDVNPGSLVVPGHMIRDELVHSADYTFCFWVLAAIPVTTVDKGNNEEEKKGEHGSSLHNNLISCRSESSNKSL